MDVMCSPWWVPRATLGDGTPADWTLVLLALSRAWGLLGFCTSGLCVEVALRHQLPPRPPHTPAALLPPPPEPACSKGAHASGKYSRDVDFKVS